MRWIVQSYHRLKNEKEAYSWFYKVIAEVPYRRESYVEFAKAAYELQDWVKVYFLVNKALKIKDKSDTYVNMGYALDYTLYDLGAIAYYKLKLFQKSLMYVQMMKGLY